MEKKVEFNDFMLFTTKYDINRKNMVTLSLFFVLDCDDLSRYKAEIVTPL